eukprot:190768_1
MQTRLRTGGKVRFDYFKPKIAVELVNPESERAFPAIFSGAAHFVIAEPGEPFFIRMNVETSEDISRFIVEIEVDGRNVGYTVVLAVSAEESTDVNGFDAGAGRVHKFEFQKVEMDQHDMNYNSLSEDETKSIGTIKISAFEALASRFEKCYLPNCVNRTSPAFPNSLEPIDPAFSFKDRKFWNAPHAVTGSCGFQEAKFECSHTSEIPGSECLFQVCLKYDTAEGLFRRGILRPLVELRHRQFFPATWKPPPPISAEQADYNPVRHNRELAWFCPCDFKNGPLAKTCSMCGEEKPDAPVMVRDLARQEMRRQRIKKEKNLTKSESCDLTQNELEIWKVDEPEPNRVKRIPDDIVVIE